MRRINLCLIVQLILEQHGFKLHGSTYTSIFFSANIVGPWVPLGFTSVALSNHGWKTVFSHFPTWGQKYCCPSAIGWICRWERMTKLSLGGWRVISRFWLWGVASLPVTLFKGQRHYLSSFFVYLLQEILCFLTFLNYLSFVTHLVPPPFNNVNISQNINFLNRTALLK